MSAETAILMIFASGRSVRWTGRPALLLAIGLGVSSSVELLNKMSVGGSFAIMSALTLLSPPEPRRVLASVGALAGAVAFVGAWTATRSRWARSSIAS